MLQGAAPWPTKFGAVLAASGMTVDELAGLIDSDKWLIQHHLWGQHTPRAATIARYCLALGCEPEDIIE